VLRLGVPLLDAYLDFVAGPLPAEHGAGHGRRLEDLLRGGRQGPGGVSSADVLGFITAQRHGGDGRLQLACDGGGVAARSVRRRLSSVSGLFAYLHARGDVAVNPVPRGLPTRRERQRPRQGVPLVRSTRTLPRVLMPGEVDALLAALRRQRDRAMVLATVLGGLRRCEVLGLRLEDLHVGQRRVFIGEGKGGHQRIVPVSARFFTAAAAYLEAERPAGIGTDRLFVALKGRRRGEPLSAYGVDEILSGATRRAGRRHPRETARHPHQSCRPVAARRSRRLDNLRRRLQPPCEHLNHESRATVDSAAPETDSEGFNI
jgi:integrase/recombinase XerD